MLFWFYIRIIKKELEFFCGILGVGDLRRKCLVVYLEFVSWFIKDILDKIFFWKIEIRIFVFIYKRFFRFFCVLWFFSYRG